MNNNRKQEIYLILDSLTQAELDNYINDRNIDLEQDNIYKNLNKIKKPETHFDKIMLNIGNDFNNAVNSYYDLGMAFVIAFVLECFYDDKYKINDLKTYLHAMIQDNPELKEMVYECMKDF
jgi:hypothetical protein